VSAADPLNLVGVVTPGERVPAIRSNRVLLRDGVPVARKVGAAIEILSAADGENGERRTLETALVRRPVPERFGRRPEETKLSEAR
jgi:ATP-dependent Lhr-like helicase